jgi:Flp pilus assembly pilin Flp
MLPTRFMTMEKRNMKRSLKQMWVEQDGVLSFEWTLIVTLLTFGIVGSLAGARDAIIDELGDFAEAAQGIDQSFSLAGLSIDFDGVGGPDFVVPPSEFEEGPEDTAFTDCTRADNPVGQPAQNDDEGP